MKDNIRDYATAAFRYYAALGQPSFDLLKKQIYDAALFKSKQELVHVKGLSNPTEQAVMAAQRAVDQRMAELLDVRAVQEVMEELELKRDIVTVRAVQIVYFTDADKPLQKGDIEDRVHTAELQIPASQRTIYRSLRAAREAFADERGIRTEKYRKIS